MALRRGLPAIAPTGDQKKQGIGGLFSIGRDLRFLRDPRALCKVCFEKLTGPRFPSKKKGREKTKPPPLE